MKKTFIYIVFRQDKYNGTSFWFAFNNRKAAQDCCDYWNEQAFSKTNNIFHFIGREELYKEW